MIGSEGLLIIDGLDVLAHTVIFSLPLSSRHVTRVPAPNRRDRDSWKIAATCEIRGRAQFIGTTIVTSIKWSTEKAAPEYQELLRSRLGSIRAADTYRRSNLIEDRDCRSRRRIESSGKNSHANRSSKPRLGVQSC